MSVEYHLKQQYIQFTKQVNAENEYKKIVKRVFDTDDGKELLRHLYARYINVPSYDATAADPEKRMLINEGKRELTLEFQIITGQEFIEIPSYEDMIDEIQHEQTKE